MKNEMLSIREMSELYQVTPRALRFYEDKELLAPVRIGQKRFFTRRDRARLKLILMGKRFGFTLNEIRRLLELYDADKTQHAQLTATYEAAQDRLCALKLQRTELEAMIKDLEEQLKIIGSRIADIPHQDQCEVSGCSL